MEKALMRLSAEMPAEVASMKDRRIRPLTGVEKVLFDSVNPGAAAMTYPNGTIAYDEGMRKAAGLSPEDLMAHELTHVGQLDRDGLLKTLVDLFSSQPPYQERANEKEAFAREYSRMGKRRRTTDIELQ